MISVRKQAEQVDNTYAQAEAMSVAQEQAMEARRANAGDCLVHSRLRSQIGGA